MVSNIPNAFSHARVVVSLYGEYRRVKLHGAGPGGQFLKTTDRGVKYPVTPGHEIAGTIESDSSIV